VAEGGDDSDKTEDPTHRRLEQAHEKGDVVKSQEVAAFFTLGAVTLIVALASGPASHALFGPLRGLIEHADSIPTDAGGLRRLWAAIGVALGTAVAAPLLIMLVAGVAGHMVQHRMVYSMEQLIPKLSKVSPLSGLKRLFSPESLVNFVKGLLKIVLVGATMTLVLWPERDRLDAMVTIDLASLLGIAQALSVEMLGAMLAVMFVIAGLDYFWVRHRWMKRQRMSLQEIKEEHKQTEGSPEVKGKIRQIRMERARSRMMAAVPQATVVITNPTHYAVALRYEVGMQAPVCVAKGVDAVALRIREIATEHKVAIVENPPLARALYATVEIDELIPEQHYRAVAEVVGFVMNLKQKSRWRQ
jgi:flagellar biosynthetic protein FlhB